MIARQYLSLQQPSPAAPPNIVCLRLGLGARGAFSHRCILSQGALALARQALDGHSFEIGNSR